MSSRLNPREYDLRELRAALHTAAENQDGGSGETECDPRHPVGRVGSSADRAVKSASDSSPTRDDGERRRQIPDVDGDIALGGPGRDAERPYLDVVPGRYRAQVEILEWLAGLLSTCGAESTREALAYYERLGWLSAECREGLEAFLPGLRAAEQPNVRPLDVDDHRRSLRYLARLSRNEYW